MELNTIYNESCLETLKRIPDGFLDITVTSPPYNVNLGNNKYNDFGYDEYNDNIPFGEYIDMLEECFYGVKRATKEGGRCCINIGDAKNGKVMTHVAISNFMIGMGWVPITTIVWEKQNISNRTSWGSFRSPVNPSFPTPFEYILIFGNGTDRLQGEGGTDISKQEFIENSLAIWRFNGENSSVTGHPAAYPIKLPYRLIRQLAWSGSVVYDPFMGSGTTAIAAKLAKCSYIGSEISAHYCDVAKRRIAPYFMQQELFSDI